ncbi:MAG: hypothetical protein CVU42_06980 [Chloroflexi bacterium HGW-Chloroflexi-4]|jgi:hypothetical protein|nr:MAG: hypothetical protein CVU42_06980 [Chloroflexi bacterium HGW-Chloroflexi-4]PKO01817.1 MAG: hypothetical protein CVU43_10815 [Chloroflexi bacterium HGW-Chloroflexi-5]
MERVQFITYKGKKILVEDFSYLNPGSEFTTTIKKAQGMIASEPKGSVLAVFDATGCSFNSDMLTQMKEFTTANTPFIKKATVVGMNGLLQVALSAVSKFSGRDFTTFKTRDEAMDFLVGL